MFIQIGKQRPAAQVTPPPERRPPVEIIFVDEERDYDNDTFMRLPFVPREGEEIQLDGDFRRRGAFIVERVVYSLVCNGRRAGWVQDDLLDVYVYLYVRETSEQETERDACSEHPPLVR